jgi:hypothetical protein
MIRTYKDLDRLKTFSERYEYLKLKSTVGQQTFGYDRYLNQMLYKSSRWKHTRDSVIIRDDGCDLGVSDRRIFGRIIIHHMNPITIEEIEDSKSNVFDPEFLVSTTFETHSAIHYGSIALLQKDLIVRQPNDTCPWR